MPKKTKSPSLGCARVILVNALGQMLVNEDYTTKARSPSKTKWIFPGGKLDVGESHLTAAKRELFEETGVQLPTDLEAVGVATYKEHSRCTVDTKLFVYHLQHTPATTPQRDEVHRCVWLSRADITELAKDKRTTRFRARCK